MFKVSIQFWCHGSDWLSSSGITPWATQELLCLSQHSQWIACSSLNAVVIQGEDFSMVLLLKRFLSFAKLLRVISLVFKFINGSRWLEVDCYFSYKDYAVTYPEELEFLLDSVGRTIPKLV